MKRMILLLLALLLLSGCQSSENSNEQEEENNSQQEEVIEEESSAVSEIKEAGSYTYTTNDSISSITVNTDGEVELIFNNFTLESDSAAIIVKKADKLTITLIGNNSLSGGDKSCPAVIYSAADIEITGSGSLSLEGKKYGIYSDKDITVDASITISTGDDGLHGDVITVRGGSLVVTSENDAIHAFDVTISTDGSITLSAEDDAIHADEDIYINGGKIRIQGHEGLEAAYIEINDGALYIESDDDGINVTDKGSIYINGGSIILISEGDGLDSNGTIYLNGGEIYIQSADDAESGSIDYDKKAYINGGTLLALGANTSQTFSNVSSQQQLYVYNLSGNANDKIEIYRLNEKIYSGTARDSYSSIIFTSEDVQAGFSYSIEVNGKEVYTVQIAEKQGSVEVTS